MTNIAWTSGEIHLFVKKADGEVKYLLSTEIVKIELPRLEREPKVAGWNAEMILRSMLPGGINLVEIKDGDTIEAIYNRRVVEYCEADILFSLKNSRVAKKWFEDPITNDIGRKVISMHVKLYGEFEMKNMDINFQLEYQDNQ